VASYIFFTDKRVFGELHSVPFFLRYDFCIIYFHFLLVYGIFICVRDSLSLVSNMKYTVIFI